MSLVYQKKERMSNVIQHNLDILPFKICILAISKKFLEYV